MCVDVDVRMCKDGGVFEVLQGGRSLRSMVCLFREVPSVCAVVVAAQKRVASLETGKQQSTKAQVCERRRRCVGAFPCAPGHCLWFITVLYVVGCAGCAEGERREARQGPPVTPSYCGCLVACSSL